ncbi:MAG: hypothetical protein N4A35_01455 [Flavobacteriales bacterium]|nr:hypothetical protein [Flavobacteriales bacterium]
MTEIKNTYKEQYLHTVMNTERVYFYQVSKTQTSHKLIFDLEKICTPEAFSVMKNKVIPLVQINLKDINAELNGKIPILYNEMTQFEWTISQLDEQGKIKDSYFLNFENKKTEFTEIDDSGDDSFEDGIEEILENVSDLEGQFLKIWDETPCEPLGEVSINDEKRYEEWEHKNRMDYMKRAASGDFPPTWGPLVLKAQSSFAIPVDTETKEDFLFIGQITSYELDLCYFCYYLFYNPNTKTVAQYMQMT